MWRHLIPSSQERHGSGSEWGKIPRKCPVWRPRWKRERSVKPSAIQETPNWAASNLLWQDDGPPRGFEREKSMNDKFDWFEAARTANMEALREMLAAGADPTEAQKSGMTPLMIAASANWLEGVKALAPIGGPLLTTPDGRTALIWGAQSGNPLIAEILIPLSDVAGSTRTGETAGQTAVWRGHKEYARRVLPKTPMDARTANGKTILMWAALGGDEEIIQLVLSQFDDEGARKAARETANNGFTALMAAAHNGNDRALGELLPVSDPNQETPDGKTPLMLAAASGSIECVRMLLPMGDLEKRDDKNWTAVDHALMLGHEAVGDEMSIAAPFSEQKSIAERWEGQVELPRLRALIEQTELGEALQADSSESGSARKKGAHRM